MSYSFHPECALPPTKIVAAFIPTVKGYVKIKPNFYLIELKAEMYKLGFSAMEVEQSIRNWYS